MSNLVEISHAAAALGQNLDLQEKLDLFRAVSDVAKVEDIPQPWQSQIKELLDNRKENMPKRSFTKKEDVNFLYKSKRLNMSKVERRVRNDIDFEIRVDEAQSDGMRFSGYAAVFNSNSEPLPFTERILPGAFMRSLKSRNEVKLFKNHNMDDVLASTRSKTLTLTEDSKGLLAEAVLPNTTAGRDLAELMKRGDVHSMSFGFSVPPKGDNWSDDGAVRELKEIRLHEVSIVTGFPAYSATTATIRSLDYLASRTAVDADQLADVMLKLEAGETLPEQEADLLVEVVQKLRENKEPSHDMSNLDLLKKKIDILYKAV